MHQLNNEVRTSLSLVLGAWIHVKHVFPRRRDNSKPCEYAEAAPSLIVVCTSMNCARYARKVILSHWVYGAKDPVVRISLTTPIL